MDLEELIGFERDGLIRRYTAALGGDRHAAEDVGQEAFLRAWCSLPRGLCALAQRAWLRRAARNLAVDELRRRSRRAEVPLGEACELPDIPDEGDGEDLREALDRLDVHQRFVLLLRFLSGLTHAEIAQLLGISEEAARKRVARARTAFASAYRTVHRSDRPLIALLARDEPGPYVEWLGAAGASVQRMDMRFERALSVADGLVITGSADDLHQGLYSGDRRVDVRGDPVHTRDRGDLAVLGAALALDLPIVGICRGHQLLNIASGGTLYQDLVTDGVTRHNHQSDHHEVNTARGTAVRRILGQASRVRSQHHQAICRLGRRLTVAATSPDGVIEAIERSDRRFVLGLQWHPETVADSRGKLVAEALIEAAMRPAA